MEEKTPVAAGPVWIPTWARRDKIGSKGWVIVNDRVEMPRVTLKEARSSSSLRSKFCSACPPPPRCYSRRPRRPGRCRPERTGAATATENGRRHEIDRLQR